MNENYPCLIYFIECYFNWSMNYDDLEKLAGEYLEIENDKYISLLKEEIKKLKNLPNSSEILKQMIYDYGSRKLNSEKSMKMLNLLVRVFL